MATTLRGDMQDKDEKQTCPFCAADWGSCDHYRILSEWETFAAQVERKTQRLQQGGDRDEA